MRRGLQAVAFMLAVCGSASAQDVRLPADFIAERLSGAECARFFSAGRLDSDLRFISELAGVRLKSTSSITIKHDAMSDRWTRLLGVSYGAAARGDAAAGKKIIDTILSLARAGALLDLPSLDQANRTKCWSGGDRNAPCPRHVVQHSGYAMIAMIISASVLEEYIAPADRAELDRYFAKGYKKFILPLSRDGMRTDGLYEFADYGIGVLAYARWTGDARLVASELKARRNSFMSKIDKDGLIDNNSFRGYRGYWYHTSGAEAALGYALIARRFGRDFFSDPALGPRLKNVASQTARGADPKVFIDLPMRGDNAIRDPSDAITHMHQFAVNLPRMIAREFGIRVSTAPRYGQLSSSETISRLVGFDARCYYASR